MINGLYFAIDADEDLSQYATVIKQKNIDGVLNYSRFLTKDMVDRYHSANLLVGVIDEHGTNDVLGGANAGATRGQQMLNKLRSYNAPSSAAAFATIDQDMSSPDDLDLADDFFTAYDTVFQLDPSKPPLFRLGGYADGTALSYLRQHGLSICWLAGAGGWSGSYAFALSGKPDMIQGATISANVTKLWIPTGTKTSILCPDLPFEYDPNIAFKALDQIGFF